MPITFGRFRMALAFSDNLRIVPAVAGFTGGWTVVLLSASGRTHGASHSICNSQLILSSDCGCVMSLTDQSLSPVVEAARIKA